MNSETCPAKSRIKEAAWYASWEIMPLVMCDESVGLNIVATVRNSFIVVRYVDAKISSRVYSGISFFSLRRLSVTITARYPRYSGIS